MSRKRRQSARREKAAPAAPDIGGAIAAAALALAIVSAGLAVDSGADAAFDAPKRLTTLVAVGIAALAAFGFSRWTNPLSTTPAGRFRLLSAAFGGAGRDAGPPSDSAPSAARSQPRPRKARDAPPLGLPGSGRGQHGRLGPAGEEHLPALRAHHSGKPRGHGCLRGQPRLLRAGAGAGRGVLSGRSPLERPDGAARCGRA